MTEDSSAFSPFTNLMFFIFQFIQLFTCSRSEGFAFSFLFSSMVCIKFFLSSEAFCSYSFLLFISSLAQSLSSWVGTCDADWWKAKLHFHLFIWGKEGWNAKLTPRKSPVKEFKDDKQYSYWSDRLTQQICRKISRFCWNLTEFSRLPLAKNNQ